MRKEVERAAEDLQSFLSRHRVVDIEAALQLLRKRGVDVGVLDRVMSSLGNASTKKRKSPRRDPKKVQSKAVSDLRVVDPSKHKILSEFERLLREGELYTQAEDLRTLGVTLDKRFPKLKNRRDLIGRLMSVLAGRSLEEIQVVINDAIPASRRTSDEYHRLATYIIKGSE